MSISAQPEQDLATLHRLMGVIDVEYEKFHGQHIKSHSTPLRATLMELAKVAKSLRASTIAKRKELTPTKPDVSPAVNKEKKPRKPRAKKTPVAE